MLIIIIILIDLISKYIVKKNFSIYTSKVIITNFFNLTYVNNTGVAWGMFSDNKFIILILDILIISLIIYFYRKEKDKLSKIGYELIIGGSIANLIDRLYHGYVIDFLDFKILGYDYPVFNLADSFIVIGVFMLIVLIGRKDND